MVIKSVFYRRAEIRELIIEQIEKPLNKVLEIVEGRLEEPKAEDTNIYNIKVLIDIYELFCKYFDTSRLGFHKERAIKGVIKWGLIKIAKDSFYRGIAEWWVEQIMRRGMDRRPYLLPSPDYWREAQPYGGGYPVTDELEGAHVGKKYLFDVREVERIGRSGQG